ncbi:MAG: hypothetical protein OXR03_02080, partial [Rhodospirillaceae bacterium]|nr:hypothetical protein [Rhodospirillaceae bacterium]
MTTLDANADLLKRQREIISRKELKPFTKRSDRPGLIYFGGLLACIFATGFLVSLSEGSRWLWPAMLLHGVMLG